MNDKSNDIEEPTNNDNPNNQTKNNKPSADENNAKKQAYSEKVQYFERENILRIQARLRALEEKLYMLHSITNLIIERESLMEKTKASITNTMLAGLTLLICPIPVVILAIIAMK